MTIYDASGSFSRTYHLAYSLALSSPACYFSQHRDRQIHGCPAGIPQPILVVVPDSAVQGKLKATAYQEMGARCSSCPLPGPRAAVLGLFSAVLGLVKNKSPKGKCTLH